MNNIKMLNNLITIFLFINVAYSQNSKVELPQTQVFKFKSTINGQYYVLNIALPDSYSDTTKRYPVLYELDAQWSFTFPCVRGIQAGLYYDGFIPEMIIVGITWPDDYDGNRGRDFTPTQVKEFPNTGGAAKFLTVIKKEIFKLIDSCYRTDPKNNTLTGGSLGGLFELYTLFHEPSLFKNYIVGNPYLEYDDGIVFKMENTFALKSNELNTKVFIHSGEYEPQKGFNKFIDQLKASKYKGFELESLVVEKMAHVSEGPYGVGRGLQFVFSNPDIRMDSFSLRQYTGQYASKDDTVTITRTGNFLYLNSALGKLKLYANTNESFYVKGLRITLQFIKDNKDKITGYNFNFENNILFYKKVN